MQGSMGLAIGVAAAVLALGAVAGLVGRLCTGRGIFGYGGGLYDAEGWVETKCDSCVGGGGGGAVETGPPPVVVPLPPPAADAPPAPPAGNGGGEGAKEGGAAES